MSEKSWYASERVNKNSGSGEHILLKEELLESGNKIAWIVCTMVRHTLVYILSFVSVHVAERVLCDIGGSSIFLRYALYFSMCLTIPASCAICYNIWNTEFWVDEDQTFCGVDLWTVQRVRYSRHSLYLDKERIDFVPSGKALYNSLNAYYNKMTGGDLP